MSTTTVRLDADEEALLDSLAPEFGGRSGVLRTGLRQLAAARQRQDALRAFVAQWDLDDGPIADDEVAAMADRYGL